MRIGVVGGSGGVGASRLAVALARRAGSALLVDADPVSGGIDVLMGLEHVPGARWSDLRLGGGRLDPALLAQRLPRRGGLAVLAADVPPPSALAVREVLRAGAALGTVVVDLPRAPSPVRDAVFGELQVVVLLAAAEVAPLAAARAVCAALPPAQLGVVLRRGSVPAREAADFLALPLLGELPRRGALRPRSRRLRRLAAGLLDGVRAGVCRQVAAAAPAITAPAVTEALPVADRTGSR